MLIVCDPETIHENTAEAFSCIAGDSFSLQLSPLVILFLMPAVALLGIQVFRGRLPETASTVFEKLKEAFSDHTIPLIREDEKTQAKRTSP
jgi:hypothetical protein